jgi:O-antigen/teichoic acid export membrane protein
VAAIHLEWVLKAIFIIALLSTYIPDLLCGFLAFRKLPNVKIRLRFFSRQMIRDTMSFSFYAYLITISHVILAKTDQLIIGAAVAVSAVVLYQVGAKLAEVFGGLAHQLPETFSPAAAHLHARGDKAFLRQLLLDGTRFTVMIATPLYIICAFYMEGLVKLLMNEKEVAPEQFWIAQVLLLWTYMVIVTQSVSKRIFVMCGHERRLMFLTVGETVLNLALSIGLVLYFRQVIWVAVASLTASIIFGWFFLWPWSAREANLSGVGLARAVLVPTALACLPVVAVIALAQTVPLLDFRQHVALMAGQAAVALVVAAISLWFVALKEVEREKLLLFFARFKGGRAA